MARQSQSPAQRVACVRGEEGAHAGGALVSGAVVLEAQVVVDHRVGKREAVSRVPHALQQHATRCRNKGLPSVTVTLWYHYSGKLFSFKETHNPWMPSV